MMLTLGPDEHNETAADRAVKEPEAQKPNRAQQRFHANFMDRACAGLRAQANAHDNLLDDDDPRAAGLNRLHFQILLACACNEWIRLKATRERVDNFAEGFWKLWSWLTRSAGHDTDEDLKTPDACRVYLKLILSSADVLDYSLLARAFVERHIKIFYNPLVPVPALSPGPLN